jgi:hypothetical protein
MKNLILISMLLLLVVGCKNISDSSIQPQEEQLVEVEKDVYTGEFIFLSDAAVLTTKEEIFAVQIDEKMHELQELAQPLKKSDFDMVNVVVKGEVVPNPMRVETGEGWEQMLIIKEIKEVTPSASTPTLAPAQTINIQEVK